MEAGGSLRGGVQKVQILPGVNKQLVLLPMDVQHYAFVLLLSSYAVCFRLLNQP